MRIDDSTVAPAQGDIDSGDVHASLLAARKLPLSWRAAKTVLLGAVTNWPEYLRLQTRRIIPLRRKLPDFLVIGAMKAGTTSFYRYLSCHPLVMPAIRKEIRFFDLLHQGGMSYYSLHFPTVKAANARGRRWDQPARTGEASPYYMFNPHVPERVSAALPNIRILALLRDPVSRAYSHYRERVRDGLETRSFELAVAEEMARLERGQPDFSHHNRILIPGRRVNYDHPYFSYLACGFYAEQLKHWYARFPHDQIMVFKSEQVFRDPHAEYQRALDFLGLPPWELAEYENANFGGTQDMNPELRGRLRAYFRNHNVNLPSLIGPEFEWED